MLIRELRQLNFPTLERQPNKTPLAQQEVHEPKSLQEYAIPLVDGIHMSIRRPNVTANKFDLKPAITQMIQGNQFRGLANDDATPRVFYME